MHRFIPIFITTILLSLHYGAIIFTNSSILANFFGPNTISLLYFLGALGNIILFLLVPKLIELFGKQRLLIFFLSLVTISTLGLGFAQTAFSVFISFTVYLSTLFIVYYFLDIFLEELSIETKTGEIRGIYLTFISLGFALGPLILATLNGTALNTVYLIATLLLIPTILLALFSFRSKFPKWHGLHPRHMFLPLGLWWRNINIRRVTLARLILEFFFAFMVIYTPIYLHSNLGFTWLELGIIFTVMQLPFVLFQWPAGELADRFCGEKEIMSIGFLITAVSLFIMPFIGKIFVVWMIILLISRIGASLILTMTESYFFKKVKAKDTRLISIFRLAQPIGIALATILGIISLGLFSFDKIFIVLAVIVLYGLKESLFIKDTR